jgi:hypothetical protein
MSLWWIYVFALCMNLLDKESQYDLCRKNQ